MLGKVDTQNTEVLPDEKIKEKELFILISL